MTRFLDFARDDDGVVRASPRRCPGSFRSIRTGADRPAGRRSSGTCHAAACRCRNFRCSKFRPGADVAAAGLARRKSHRSRSCRPERRGRRNSGSNRSLLAEHRRARIRPDRLAAAAAIGPAVRRVANRRSETRTHMRRAGDAGDAAAKRPWIAHMPIRRGRRPRRRRPAIRPRRRRGRQRGPAGTASPQRPRQPIEIVHTSIVVSPSRPHVAAAGAPSHSIERAHPSPGSRNDSCDRRSRAGVRRRIGATGGQA